MKKMFIMIVGVLVFGIMVWVVEVDMLVVYGNMINV